jgi:hypothetical protein
MLLFAVAAKLVSILMPKSTESFNGGGGGGGFLLVLVTPPKALNRRDLSAPFPPYLFTILNELPAPISRPRLL